METTVEYVFTVGQQDFVSGVYEAHPLYAMDKFIGMVLNKHHAEIAAVNGGVGGRLNVLYSTFITNQEAIEITAVVPGGRGNRAMRLSKHDTLEAAMAQGLTCIRCHIDVLNHRGGGEDWKKRFLRFYNYYNPEKLVIVERMLQDARGYEEEVMKMLIARYGPEPTPSVDLRFRDRLTAFYHHYNPERVPEVDAILLEYNGMEEQLFGALVAKYGPEPIIMGSEADSDDSFTYTADSENPERLDPHPLAVPLMPFITPLHDHELPEEPEFSSDIHFWDNFVNQMPGEAEEAFASGLDCNQELLQQFMKSYPILFPHIITVTCPFKEQVFRGSNEFWQYIKARGETNQQEVMKADASHVVRAVSSIDTQHPAVLFTRREWQDLAADWEGAHGLERRVRVGSVALDADPNAPPMLPPRPPPVMPPPTPPETVTQVIQTTQDQPTQTAPDEPPPPPPEPIHQGRLANVGGRALPVAWPISTLAKPAPEREDNDPPIVGDDSMEPYLRQALADAQRRQTQPEARTFTTQTAGWVPPPTNTTLTRAGPSPRRVIEEPAPNVRDGMLPFKGRGLPTIKVMPSQGSVESRGSAPKEWDSVGTDDFMEVLNPRKALQQASVRRANPTATPQSTTPPTPYVMQNRACPRGPNPTASASVPARAPFPSSIPSTGPRSEGDPKDQYWKAFLQQMQSLTAS